MNILNLLNSAIPFLRKYWKETLIVLFASAFFLKMRYINFAVMLSLHKAATTKLITRIESVVTNGSVLAEAIIDGELTSNSRPSLTISAQVFVKHMKDALYIRQSTGLRPQTKQALFVRSQNNLLEQREVIFGELSQDKLLITSGLSFKDELVITDISQHNQFSKIALTH